jgi:hypothetical protein
MTQTIAYISDTLFSHQINQMTQRIASVRTSTEIANEIGGNISNVKQAVQQITWQVFKTSNQGSATSVINQIFSQLAVNPKGLISRSIWRFAQQLEKGAEIDITQISPPPERAIENFNTVILIDATNNQNAAMDIHRASQSIANANQQTSHFSQSSCSGNNCKSLGITNIAYIDINKVNKLANPVYVIEDILRQTVIEIAIKASQSSADQFVQQLTNNPSGPDAKSIHGIAQLQDSGQISTAIDNLALSLASDGMIGDSVKIQQGRHHEHKHGQQEKPIEPNQSGPDHDVPDGSKEKLKSSNGNED